MPTKLIMNADDDNHDDKLDYAVEQNTCDPLHNDDDGWTDAKIQNQSIEVTEWMKTNWCQPGTLKTIKKDVSGSINLLNSQGSN